MPDETIDTAVSTLATAAESALEPIVASKMDLFAQRGHEIITTELARAKILANTYPAVGVLLPVIESTLRTLFAHMIAGPDTAAPVLAPSRVESAAPVLQRRPAEVASDEPPTGNGDKSEGVKTDAAFPPVRDDKVPAPEAPAA